MKPRIIYFLLMLLTLSMPAVAAVEPLDTVDATLLKHRADSAYDAEQYREAVDYYLALSRRGESARVCYNLGNCYYRMDKMSRAVLWYERALLLNPGDRDTRINLNLARTQTVDQYVPADEFFFVSWYHQLVNLTSVDGWAMLSILFFALMLVGIGLYIFAHRVAWRKCGFYGALLMGLFVVLGNVFAYQLRSRQQHRTGAIVMKPTVNVRTTPSQQGRVSFTLHEGTRVDITDDTMREWRQVELSDGKNGWLRLSDVELI